MKRVGRVFIAIILLAFLSGVGSHFSLWENQTTFSKRPESINYRQVNFLTTLEMGRAHPIFGIGFGNFWNEWPKYIRSEDIGLANLSEGNHNTFLGLFAEVGVVGLIPYLLIFYQMLRVGLRVYSREKGFDQGFSLIFLLVAMSFVTGANFSDYRSAPFYTTTLFILFGAVAAMDGERQSAATSLQDDSGVPGQSRVAEKWREQGG